MEEWRDVIGYEGSYKVSNKGNIKSLDRLVTQTGINGEYTRLYRGILLKGSFDKDGYLLVSLSKEGVGKTLKVHRIVFEAFVGKIPEKYQINHIDHVKTNNTLENLEAITSLENNQKKIEFYGVVNKKSVKIPCVTCGEYKQYSSRSIECRKCSLIRRRVIVDRPSLEYLTKELETRTFTSLGKEFNVSCNTIRNWLKSKQTSLSSVG